MTLSANFSSIDTAEAALRRIRAACPGIHKIRILASPTHRIAGSGMDRHLPGVFSIVPTRTTAMGNEFVTQVMSETLPSRHDPEPFLRESGAFYEVYTLLKHPVPMPLRPGCRHART